MDEIIFQVNQDINGGFTADCVTEAISAKANTWEELRRNVKKAVAAFYVDRIKRPKRVHLQLLRDEVLVQR